MMEYDEYIIRVDKARDEDGGRKILKTEELVRCKDCKYHECTDVCEMHGIHTEEHEFCSRGGRGDNEEKAVEWE